VDSGSLASPPDRGRSEVMRPLEFARRQLDDLFRAECWNVGIVHAPIDRFVDPAFEPEVHWLPKPPRDRFYADPFGLWVDGRLIVLLEVYDQRRQVGYLAATESRDGVRFSEPRRILSKPTHLSYPYLVEDRGAVYCIPETAESRRVEIYRASRFPSDWEPLGPLIEDFPGLDATPFPWNGRWWMFASDRDRLPEDVLHLWHADELLGPWRPHPGNPVSRGQLGVRSAGTPFVHEGALFRPAQDCSESYGGALVINEVTRLDEATFSERQVRRITSPDRRFGAGFHTLAAAGPFTLVDGKRMGWVPQETGRRLRWKLRKALGRRP
jgi:hypothetical protein